MRKIWITGASGQLGTTLQHTAPQDVTLLTPTRTELDLTDASAVTAYFNTHKPHAIINAAAYTAVDKAETEAAQAVQLNENLPALLADLCSANNTKLVHISTDFVFDGQAGTPYTPDATCNPLSVYGKTKRAGEIAALKNPQTLVLRTAWLYSAHGHNFVKTMLRLMGEKEQLSIVADQIGTPTTTATLANAIWQALDNNLTGIHHCTDAGCASWYDFAVAINEEACALGLLPRAIPLNPINSAAYPLPAKRPNFSVMDKSSLWHALSITPQHWRTGLKATLQQIQTLAAGK